MQDIYVYIQDDYVYMQDNSVHIHIIMYRCILTYVYMQDNHVYMYTQLCIHYI